MSERYKGIVSLFLATFIGGGIAPTLIRWGVSSIHPFVFNTFRSMVTVTFLGLLFSHKMKEVQLNTQEKKHFAVLGMLLGGNILLFSMGVSHTTVVVSQLLYNLMPFTVAAMSYLVLQEKITPQKILGAGIALLGASVLLYFSQHQTNSLGTLYGNGMIFMAVWLYSLYYVLSKKELTHLNPVAVAAFSYLGSLLVFVPLALYQLPHFDALAVTQQSWLSVFLIGIASAFHMVLTQYGIKRVKSGSSSH